MYRVIKKSDLAPAIVLLEVEAPAIAAKVRPGQFVIVRTDEFAERIPLTVADFHREAGTIELVVQNVGFSSALIQQMEENSAFLDVVGPLGQPSEIEHYGTVVCIGGGVGIAPVFPIARALKEAGNKVISVLGVRSAGLMLMQAELESVSDEVVIATNDGSLGVRGFVTDGLSRILERGTKVDKIWAIGPMIMMKAVADYTKPLGLPTIVSMNPIMVDGTGMCGACRVKIGNETKFACVDGPEFDAHLVDFELAMHRLNFFKDEEQRMKASLECGCQGRHG